MQQVHSRDNSLASRTPGKCFPIGFLAFAGVPSSVRWLMDFGCRGRSYRLQETDHSMHSDRSPQWGLPAAPSPLSPHSTSTRGLIADRRELSAEGA